MEDKVRKTIEQADREKANIEAEKGETIVTYLFGTSLPEHYKIEGKKHSKGGTPLNVPDGSFVFSDSKELMIYDKWVLDWFGEKKPTTPAKIAEKYDLNKYKAILRDPEVDGIKKLTAILMLKNNYDKLAELALVQESIKNYRDGIPVFAEPYLAEYGIDKNQLLKNIKRDQDSKKKKAYGGNVESKKVSIGGDVLPLYSFIAKTLREKASENITEATNTEGAKLLADNVGIRTQNNILGGSPPDDTDPNILNKIKKYVSGDTKSLDLTLEEMNKIKNNPKGYGIAYDKDSNTIYIDDEIGLLHGEPMSQPMFGGQTIFRFKSKIAEGIPQDTGAQPQTPSDIPQNIESTRQNVKSEPQITGYTSPQSLDKQASHERFKREQKTEQTKEQPTPLGKFVDRWSTKVLSILEGLPSTMGIQDMNIHHLAMVADAINQQMSNLSNIQQTNADRVFRAIDATDKGNYVEAGTQTGQFRPNEQLPRYTEQYQIRQGTMAKGGQINTTLSEYAYRDLTSKIYDYIRRKKFQTGGGTEHNPGDDPKNQKKQTNQGTNTDNASGTKQEQTNTNSNPINAAIPTTGEPEISYQSSFTDEDVERKKHASIYGEWVDDEVVMPYFRHSKSLPTFQKPIPQLDQKHIGNVISEENQKRIQYDAIHGKGAYDRDKERFLRLLGTPEFSQINPEFFTSLPSVQKYIRNIIKEDSSVESNNKQQENKEKTKQEQKKLTYADKYRPKPDTGFYRQDLNNIALANALYAGIKTYLPWSSPVDATLPSVTYYDPRREIQGVAASTNTIAQQIQRNLPSTLAAANLAQLQAQTAQQAADAIARAQQQNVGISNQYEQLRANILNNLANYEAARQKEMYDKTVLAKQRTDEDRAKALTLLTALRNQALSNWVDKYNLQNVIYADSPFYTDEYGRLILDPERAKALFDPNKTPKKTIEEQYSKLVEMFIKHGMSTEEATKKAAEIVFHDKLSKTKGDKTQKSKKEVSNKTIEAAYGSSSISTDNVDDDLNNNLEERNLKEQGGNVVSVLVDYLRNRKNT